MILILDNSKKLKSKEMKTIHFRRKQKTSCDSEGGPVITIPGVQGAT